ncbi:hypothetical protein ONE63_010164 [Megalurothrips usitatus]|uniref:Mitochondrial ribosomal protein S34 n=1 Tax=Megalurothrips usitatus TaxID=439358 RepID=A0AAV7XNJ4_9NEOP|nr:hypothetical protein ONE63_010164 [Megalurothrips usitatus]
MPYEFYGKATPYCGKALWEILGNLKNHGVGRIVVRNQFKRYPEPSWYRILKVEGLSPEGRIQACPPVIELDEVRRVRALVDSVFRGTYRGQEWLAWPTFKPDFNLIPKEEEEAYTKVKAGELPKSFEFSSILPTHGEFPPLLRELLIRDLKAQGTYNGEEPMLPISFKNPVRVAQEGEAPTVRITPGLGTPVCPRLYDNIKKN